MGSEQQVDDVCAGRELMLLLRDQLLYIVLDSSRLFGILLVQVFPFVWVLKQTKDVDVNIYGNKSCCCFVTVTWLFNITH